MCSIPYSIRKLFTPKATKPVEQLTEDGVLAKNVASFVVQRLTVLDLKRNARDNLGSKILLEEIQTYILEGQHRTSSQAELTNAAHINCNSSSNLPDNHHDQSSNLFNTINFFLSFFIILALSATDIYIYT
ncbi:hypothetical protein GEMRC1_009515 [Eukaryota sp. GEM-RC1]